jgi:hypothetical protein
VSIVHDVWWRLGYEISDFAQLPWPPRASIPARRLVPFECQRSAGAAGWLARLGCGDDTELGQQRVHVQASPAFLGLTVGDAADVDGLDADVRAGGGHAHEVAGVGCAVPELAP